MCGKKCQCGKKRLWRSRHTGQKPDPFKLIQFKTVDGITRLGQYCSTGEWMAIELMDGFIKQSMFRATNVQFWRELNLGE